MRNYQTVIILKPDLDENQVNEVVEKVTQMIGKCGGLPIKTEKWGKKRLAYRVKKNRFGNYLNIFHTCDNLKAPQLETEFRLYEQIIKYMMIRLEQDELDWALGKAATLIEAKEGEETPVSAMAGGRRSRNVDKDDD